MAAVPDIAKLQLSVEDGGESVVVAVTGEVDITVADRLRECLLAQAGPGRRIVIDMSGLRFMDSSGLSALVAVRRSMGTDGVIVLQEPNSMVRKLLEVTGAQALFEVA